MTSRALRITHLVDFLRKQLISFLVGLVCMAPFMPAGIASDLKGRIVLTKRTRKQVAAPIYQLRGRPALRDSDAAQETNEYSDVVVFLSSNSSSTAKPVHAELRQYHQQFRPKLLVVPVGSTVSFPNSDPIFHNVFSLSRAKTFDLGYYPMGQTRVVRFDEPGVVQVYCHLHPNMYAAIVVTPSRWYTRPAADGSFTLNGVPAGTYHLVAWHMRAGFFEREVLVGEANPTDIVCQMPAHEQELIR
jgi:plastocyanin